MIKEIITILSIIGNFMLEVMFYGGITALIIVTGFTIYTIVYWEQEDKIKERQQDEGQIKRD